MGQRDARESGEVPTSNMVPSFWYNACQSGLAQQRSFERRDNLVDEAGTSNMVPWRCKRGTTLTVDNVVPRVRQRVGGAEPECALCNSDARRIAAFST
jgi:hypothetical protein